MGLPEDPGGQGQTAGDVSEVIRITGIAAEGRHGATPGERDRPQRFVVDVTIEVEPTGDDLDTTADYRAVVDAVRRIIEVESYALIETMARRVASVVSELPGVHSCRAVVRKPAAADRLGAEDVSAEAVAPPSG